jgi:hypothetical protein
MARIKREDMDPVTFVDTMSATMLAETSDGRGDDEDEEMDEETAQKKE